MCPRWLFVGEEVRRPEILYTTTGSVDGYKHLWTLLLSIQIEDMQILKPVSPSYMCVQQKWVNMCSYYKRIFIATLFN